MDTEKDCDLQSICTVNQMANKLSLSRARLYQLINDGVFPPPAYCCLSKKPVYPSHLQEACLEIRKTGIGWKGQLVRFYKHRKKAKPKPEHKEVIQSNIRITKIMMRVLTNETNRVYQAK